MQFTERETAHILLAVRHCEDNDIHPFPLLSNIELDRVCCLLATNGKHIPEDVLCASMPELVFCKPEDD